MAACFGAAYRRYRFLRSFSGEIKRELICKYEKFNNLTFIITILFCQTSKTNIV